jgi:hypothetical protein
MTCMQGAVETQAKMLGDSVHHIEVGEYRGFKVNVHCVRNEIMFSLKGEREYHPANLSYMKDDKFSLAGFLQRIDNYVDGFERERDNAHAKLARDQAELAKAQDQATMPFKDMAHLERLRRDNAEILIELKKMQKDETYVSTWKPSGDRDNDTPVVQQAPEADLFGAPLLAARDVGTLKRADAVIAEFLRAAMLPAKAHEVLGARSHDALWEQGDGAEVHEVVLERIAASRDLAGAVMANERYASIEMKDAAQETVSRFDARETALRKEGWAPHTPNRVDGRYAGQIIAVDEHFVVQDLGMHKAALHARRDFSAGAVPAAGEHVHLAYSNGAVVLRSREAQAHGINR